MNITCSYRFAFIDSAIAISGPTPCT